MRYTFTLVRMSKTKKTVTNVGVYFSFFSVAVIKKKNQTPESKATQGRTGFICLIIIAHHRAGKFRGRILRQQVASHPQSKVERNECSPASCYICLLALFSLIYVTQGLTQGKTQPTVGWSFIHQLTSKTISKTCLKTSCSRRLANCLFLGDCRLCHTERISQYSEDVEKLKPSYTDNGKPK